MEASRFTPVREQLYRAAFQIEVTLYGVAVALAVWLVLGPVQ
jgi:hypothetical protein